MAQVARTAKHFLPLAALVALAAACVNGDATTGQLEEAMVNAGASDDEATCIAEEADGAFSQDQLNEVADASELDDLPDGLREEVTTILDDCLDGGADGSNSDAGADADTGGNGAEDGQGTETTDPDS